MGRNLRGGAVASLLVTGVVVWFVDLASLAFRTSAATLDPTTITVTNIFCRIIIGLFLVGVVQLIARWTRLATFAGSIPTHLTALGILGTFVGIFLGLYKFNPHNLQESVPLLLDGLKVAFSTSILGLTTSTGLKVGHALVVSITTEDPFVGPPVDVDG